MSEPWNGIPDDPHKSGWHWIARPDRMWPCKWSAEVQTWGPPLIGFSLNEVAKCEYLGPATPPLTRCKDGSRRVAVSAKFICDHDQVGVTMNDGSTHYLDGYYWHNGQTVFEIIGKTIPEIEAAAKQYREPKQEGTTT